MIILQNHALEIELLHPLDHSDRLGSRYSHSGYIRQIHVEGRAVLGRPVESFDVFNGEGFPDEFEEPIGYEQCEIGEAFLKLGVGAVEKTGDHPYTNHDRHPVRTLPKHTVTVESAQAVFEQQLTVGKYGYCYTKTVSMDNETAFCITHRLENTGDLPLRSFWYSHIFLNRQAFGGAVRMTLPESYRSRDGNVLSGEFGAVELPDGREGCFWWDVPEGGQDRHDVRGSALTFSAQGNYSCMEHQMFMNPQVISPEPRIRVALDVGESMSWATNYSFEWNT